MHFLFLVKLILRPRSEILESLSSKKDGEEEDVNKSSEQEMSKSQSEISSSEEDDSSEPGFVSQIL